MGPITYFDTELLEGKQISGSSFGEPDGTLHDLVLMEGNGQMILRVKLSGQKPVDLMFDHEQAISFASAAVEVLDRLGINPNRSPR